MIDLRMPRRTPRRPLMIMVAGFLAAVLTVTGCGRIPDNPLGSDQPSGAAGQPTGSTAQTPSASAAGGPTDCEYTQTGTPSKKVSLPPTRGVPMSGTATAVITMAAGTITLTLDRNRAPCTVNSFVSLAKQKFYDNTVCPRMTDASSIFVLQCGSGTTTREGGPGYTFPDELSGDETYGAGTLAMANGAPNTNGSQFFMVYRDSQIDPNYTVFGSIDAKGIAVLDKIAQGGVDNAYGPHDGRPKSDAKIISVTIS